MQSPKKILSLVCFIVLSLGLHAQALRKDIRTLVVFFDGLRPDYITEKNMPNLYAFSKLGCYGKQHHSVFPTVTRVNASSFSSGSYPGTHGLMGNTVYFPQVDKMKGLNTSSYDDLDKINKVTQGHLLTAITLGEVLHKAGAGMMVFSSGSPGQAMMQNHTVGSGAIVNPTLILPESFKGQIVKDLGSPPENAKPNAGQHRWVTNALIRYGLTLDGPLVSSIWFSDPDGVAHEDGIGSGSAMESIKIVDAEFGRILDALKSKNLNENFNVIVSADHGFVTHVGKKGVADFLIEKGIKKDKDSDDVIVVGGAIYVKGHDAGIIKNIVSVLQAEEWVGGIFTRGGKIPGTISFETIHWDHEARAADILVDENWTDGKNENNFAGTSFSTGVAGHGGLSPYEVHIALLTAGPSFKKKFSSNLPTSNVDLAPTILAIHELPIPPSMNGRVMHELLVNGSGESGTKVKKHQVNSSTQIPGGKYTVTVYQTHFGKYQYVDFAKTERVKDK
ncbi:MAG TPA: alkaline phosphatase family protein [Chryseolinea sp.]